MEPVLTFSVTKGDGTLPPEESRSKLAIVESCFFSAASRALLDDSAMLSDDLLEGWDTNRCGGSSRSPVDIFKYTNIGISSFMGSNGKLTKGISLSIGMPTEDAESESSSVGAHLFSEQGWEINSVRLHPSELSLTAPSKAPGIPNSGWQSPFDHGVEAPSTPN